MSGACPIRLGGAIRPTRGVSGAGPENLSGPRWRGVSGAWPPRLGKAGKPVRGVSGAGLGGRDGVCPGAVQPGALGRRLPRCRTFPDCDQVAVEWVSRGTLTHGGVCWGILRGASGETEAGLGSVAQGTSAWGSAPWGAPQPFLAAAIAGFLRPAPPATPPCRALSWALGVAEPGRGRE